MRIKSGMKYMVIIEIPNAYRIEFISWRRRKLRL